MVLPLLGQQCVHCENTTVLVVSTSCVLTVAKNVNSSSSPCSLKVTLFDGQSLQRMQCGIFLRWKVNLVYLAFSRILG